MHAPAPLRSQREPTTPPSHWGHIEPAQVGRGHETAIVERGRHQDALGIGGSMSIGLRPHIPCPISVITDGHEIVLSKKLVFEVAHHGRGARPEGARREARWFKAHDKGRRTEGFRNVRG